MWDHGLCHTLRAASGAIAAKTQTVTIVPVTKRFRGPMSLKKKPERAKLDFQKITMK